MLIHQCELEFFKHVIKENGGGEYRQSPNQFSHSRQSFGTGMIFYHAPVNNYIEISTTIDDEELKNIWNDAIKQAAEKIEANKEDATPQEEN